jgi:hypothetical protein
MGKYFLTRAMAGFYRECPVMRQDKIERRGAVREARGPAAAVAQWLGQASSNITATVEQAVTGCSCGTVNRETDLLGPTNI